jgi:hypothetical protein
MDLLNELVIDGDDLTVKRADGTGAYRLRVTGGGLDLEIGGLDVIVSCWSGADFTGTQTPVMRWEAAGPHLIGRTRIGTSPYDAVFDLDPATAAATFNGDLTVTGNLNGAPVSTLATTTDRDNLLALLWMGVG